MIQLNTDKIKSLMVDLTKKDGSKSACSFSAVNANGEKKIKKLSKKTSRDTRYSKLIS